MLVSNQSIDTDLCTWVALIVYHLIEVPLFSAPLACLIEVIVLWYFCALFVYGSRCNKISDLNWILSAMGRLFVSNYNVMFLVKDSIIL